MRGQPPSVALACLALWPAVDVDARWAGQGHWRSFENESLVSGKEIRAITQSPGGEIWVAGDDGLLAYDGLGWRREQAVGIEGLNVTCLLFDHSGTLWIGTDRGLFAAKDRIARPAAELGSLGVLDLAQDPEGDIWVANASGLTRLSRLRSHLARVPEPQGELVATALAFDIEGRLWAAHGELLSRLEAGSMRATELDTRLAEGPIRGMRADPWGRIWTLGESTLQVGDDGAWIEPDPTGPWAAGGGRSLYVDREGVVWIGMHDGLIAYFADQVRTFKALDGLPNSKVMTIWIDRDQRIWIGTPDGAAYFENGRWRMEDASVYLRGREVEAFWQDENGDYWFGTDEGVVRQRGEEWDRYSRAEGLIYPRVEVLTRDQQGRLWIGTDRGVSCWDGASWHSFTSEQGLVHEEIEDLLVARDGSLWFATDGGVSCFDGNAWRTYRTSDGIPHNHVRCILQDSRGHLWFGTNGGAARFDGTSWRILTADDGLADNYIERIIEDNAGHLWFATNDGVSGFDGHGFSLLTTDDGLSDNAVRDACQSADGALWFATQGGVTRFHRKRGSKPAIRIDSVATSSRREPAATVHLESNPALTAFEFHGLSTRTRAEAMTYVYRLTAIDAEWKTTRSRRVEYPSLPPGTHTFEVMVLDRDLASSDIAQVQIHVPKSWLYPLLVLLVAMSSTLFGIQTLRVFWRERRLRHLNEELRASHEDLELRVQARTAEIAEANRSLAAEVAERVQAESRTRATLAEKELLLHELHHRVKNNLQIVCSLISLQMSRRLDPESLRALRETHSRIRSMALVHENLHGEKEHAHLDFRKYIEDLCGEIVRSHAGPAPQHEVQVHVGDVSIGMTKGVLCGLVINELLANCMEHAFPDGRQGRIEVELHAGKDGMIRLSVSDDGVGIPDDVDPEAPNSLGLRLVRSLVHQLEGELSLLADRGSRFEITFREARAS